MIEDALEYKKRTFSLSRKTLGKTKHTRAKSEVDSFIVTCHKVLSDIPSGNPLAGKHNYFSRLEVINVTTEKPINA